MWIRVTGLTVGALLASAAASAGTQTAQKESGPCAQIAAACKSAGFIEGDYKTGNGLHKDCIDPIMRGGSRPPNAKLALPKVDSELVAACKQKHPNFGEPKKAADTPAAK
jgi:hypothetical protein